jgi:phosphoribosylformylglycinamidine synthase
MLQDSALSAPAGAETAQKLGLTQEEFELICKIMGRTPNFTELSIYSVMWSEHCSYKNSIYWLKQLPREGKVMLAKAGEENAGLVDIGDGLACAFKIESHNHPSAVEPYQGAATGVGGINRDIFTMGARPVAQLNSLRFGFPEKARNRWLIRGVTKGIGNYGNAFGVPVLAGEVFFDDCYDQNPLVNAMSVGIVKHNETISAIAGGIGNPVFIVGSATGKDGIHGATFASADITENSADDLPAVQVGDPFQEKLLLEASLEVIKTGAVVGMQDMGAAGITCSTSEMSAKGNCGMRIFLDKVPMRQQDMKPFEILLSESQERMLVVVKKGMEKDVLQVFEKWDLNCSLIGEVTEGPNLEYFYRGEKVAEVNAESLVLGGGAPVYKRAYNEPEWYARAQKFLPDSIALPSSFEEVAKAIISHPNICSKQWIYNQYDSMIGTGSLNINNRRSAGLYHIKDSQKAIGMTVDCNSRYVQCDPEKGTAIAVFEAARNLACSGATPLAVTNCLNFGNPYNTEVYWQFVHAIKGMSLACNILDTPVTGGNVSFYNQFTHAGVTVPVFPTPTIGMIGLVHDISKIAEVGFGKTGDVILLLANHPGINANGSQYLRTIHGITESPAPNMNPADEHNLIQLLLRLIGDYGVKYCNDVSDGGIFTALCEMGFSGSLGFEVNQSNEARWDYFWFGETQGQALLAVSEHQVATIKQCALSYSTACHVLGTVSTGNISVDGKSVGDIKEYYQLYHQMLGDLMERE